MKLIPLPFGTGRLGIVTRSITVDHTQCGSTDSTNFPLLVSAQDNSLRSRGNGGHVYRTDGYDILFYSDSGLTTLLNWEIDMYDPVTGTVIMWVSIPTVSHTVDTVIYMNYGNSTITTFQGGATGIVWTNDGTYKAVYHFGDGVTLSVTDYSNTGNDLTNTGSIASTGKIGGSVTTQTSVWYMYKASATGLPTGSTNRTVSCWFKKTNSTSNQEAFSYGDNSAGGKRFGLFYGTNQLQVETAGVSSVFSWTRDANWHHIAAVLPSGATNLNQAVIYFDGVSQSLTSGSQVLNTASDIGVGTVAGAATSNNWSGQLDECRISNAEKSADWILTEYNNQNLPGNIGSPGFLTYSNEF